MEENNNEIIWLEKDMFMKNIGLFGEVSVDYLEILENAIEENVIHYTFDEYLYILEGELLVFKGNEKKLLKENEYIIIPKNTIHGSINKSGKLVKMLSICNPPFTLEDMNKVNNKNNR